MTLVLTTSLDGKWAAARDGRQLVLFASCAGAPVAQTELPSDDVDFALVGPPTTLAVVSRNPDAVTLYEPPSLAPANQLALDISARLAAVCGPRVALLSPDSMHMLVVRTSGRALSTRLAELVGPIEFIVGLEPNQLLLSLPKKLEILDASSHRPLVRPAWPLPPPPRVLGAALGHLWAMRPNRDHIIVYRLSDGRPFEYDAGAQIETVVSHAASPVIVLVTPSGLFRLHVHAHTITPIQGVPETRGALALVVDGDEVFVAGFTGLGNEPWRVRVTRPT